MNYYREDDAEMVQEMVNCGGKPIIPSTSTIDEKRPGLTHTTDWILKNTGMTPDMAKDKNLIAMILPAIKADHLAMDKYVFDPNGKSLPILSALASV